MVNSTTYRWISDVFFNGLASILEGTSLAGFNELILVLMIGFDVEVFNPCTSWEPTIKYEQLSVCK